MHQYRHVFVYPRPCVQRACVHFCKRIAPRGVSVSIRISLSWALIIRISLSIMHRSLYVHVCVCVCVCVDTHNDMLTFVPGHAHHAHGRIHACTHENVCKCMCVSACEGRNEREKERESERESARARICVCMGVRVCIWCTCIYSSCMISITSIWNVPYWYYHVWITCIHLPPSSHMILVVRAIVTHDGPASPDDHNSHMIALRALRA